VQRLLWSSNSSDLNMIESCWPWMKRQTTRINASRSRAAVDKAWFECWHKKLSQNRIQK
jgi:transposase